MPPQSRHRLRWRVRRSTAEDSDFLSASSSAEELEDVDFILGPNPSETARRVLTQQFQEFAEGQPADVRDRIRERCAEGPSTSRGCVRLSDCMIMDRMSGGQHTQSFGTALHLGRNCTILCSVCSFNRSNRRCKNSWLCDFCHAQVSQQRNKRKGSGAWQVSQLSSEHVDRLYEELREAHASSPSGSQAVAFRHPRTIPDRTRAGRPPGGWQDQAQEVHHQQAHRENHWRVEARQPAMGSPAWQEPTQTVPTYDEPSGPSASSRPYPETVTPPAWPEASSSSQEPDPHTLRDLVAQQQQLIEQLQYQLHARQGSQPLSFPPQPPWPAHFAWESVQHTQSQQAQGQQQFLARLPPTPDDPSSGRSFHL
mmetsp:Transcript_19646/g.45700  ORF Transcript_19646/g.45700 Transcript_19646/m.45700 type:complete len:367 (+) Transcript_19646:117-1217(+)